MFCNKYNSIFIYRFITIAIACMNASHASVEKTIRNGNWSIQTETYVQQIPMNIQPASYHQCLGPDSPAPVIPDAGKSCSIIKQNINDNEVRWELHCNVSTGSRSGKGYVKYNGNNLRGYLDMKVTHPSYKIPHHFQFKLKGRRTGPCKHQ